MEFLIQKKNVKERGYLQVLDKDGILYEAIKIYGQQK